MVSKLIKTLYNDINGQIQSLQNLRQQFDSWIKNK